MSRKTMGSDSDPRDTITSWPSEVRSDLRETLTPSTEQFELDDGVPRPLFQRVFWMREPHLRKLYGLTCILMIASATTGYDGMLLNISQHIRAWNYFFFPELKDNPDLEDKVLDSKLAIMVNMFNIGSVLSFFITPFIADNYGRRIAILIGSSIMMSGGFLTAFCNGYGSKLPSPLTCHTSIPLSGLPTDHISVHGWPLPPRLRQLPVADGFTPSPHRDLPPAAPWCHHSHLQLSLERGCSLRVLSCAGDH